MKKVDIGLIIQHIRVTADQHCRDIYNCRSEIRLVASVGTIDNLF